MIDFLKKQFYAPTFFGLLLNPSFISRTFLYKRIKIIGQEATGDLLDFGCGTKPYHKLFKHITSYIGCDISESGNKNLKQADVIYDGHVLPFNNESFDIIIAFEVFEHIFNLDEILRELYRVLKKNGSMIISIPFFWPEHELPYDFARYTEPGMIYLLEQSGFRIKKQYKTGKGIIWLVQLFQIYIYTEILPKKYFLRSLLSPIFLMPLTILGFSINIFFKKSSSYYLNNFFYIEKETPNPLFETLCDKDS